MLRAPERLLLVLLSCSFALALRVDRTPFEVRACRRHVLGSLTAGVFLLPPCAHAAEERSSAWGPAQGLTASELEELDVTSRTSEGVVMPNGVRVIDVVKGSGPGPQKGTKVYVHYKIWANGFRNGPVADFSYLDGRPYSWFLGYSNERIPTLVDESMAGMREGGWRRLVVPNAYPEGLKRINRLQGGARYTPPKAGYVVKPGAFAFFDIILMDGGSGRCDTLLNPPNESEEARSRLRTMNCMEEEVKVALPGIGTSLLREKLPMHS